MFATDPTLYGATLPKHDFSIAPHFMNPSAVPWQGYQPWQGAQRFLPIAQSFGYPRTPYDTPFLAQGFGYNMPVIPQGFGYGNPSMFGHLNRPVGWQVPWAI